MSDTANTIPDFRPSTRAACNSSSSFQEPAIEDLRCDYRWQPLGIDNLTPKFSWAMTGNARGQEQRAYQILVASTAARAAAGQGDIWDSGKVSSGISAGIVYEGVPLCSATRYYWTVTVWDQTGRRLVAEPSWFEMGLLDQKRDWKAVFIAAAEQEPASVAPMFRRVFQVDAARELRQARLYASSLGIYEVHINGQKVGADLLTPGWTDYYAYAQYQTYDITDMLNPGENAVGAIVGNGWYAGNISINGNHKYGVEVAFLAQLVLTYADGKQEIIATDGTWKSTRNSPFLATDNQDGETYDATRELPGWNCPGFSDDDWQGVRVAGEDAFDTKIDLKNLGLVAQADEPVQQTETLLPQAMTEPEPGVYIFDLGQNMTGWVRMHVQGPAGTTVRLRFGEMLQQDGTLYTANLRSAKATDYYTLKGDPAGEVYEPHFTFHGFRYAELTNYPGKPTLGDVEGIVVGTNLRRTGTIETSDPLVNQLFSNIVWGQRDNYLSVPMDCPQRDERLGWTGDAQIFVRTGTLNYCIAAFFTKYLRDVRTAQRPDGSVFDIAPKEGHQVGTGNAGWGDVAVIAPWTIYTAYNDTQIIRDNYSMMRRWIAYYKERSNGTLIVPSCDYGDWLSIGETTPRDVVATAYFAYSTALLAKMAAIIGKEEDARQYRELFLQIRDAFNKAFVEPDTGAISGNTQTAYLLALRFDLLPSQELRKKAAANLVARLQANDWHLTTGFLGVSSLCPVLCDVGYPEIAYRLLLTQSYPSWLYSVVNGATTVWERWNSYVAETGTFGNVEMNSFNHYSYGSIGEWLYQYAAGIRYDENNPAYKHLLLQPVPSSQLPHVCGTYDSVYGRICSDWSVKDGSFILTVTIPANTTATVRVPSGGEEGLMVDGTPVAYGITGVEGVQYRGCTDGWAEFEIASGSYTFASILPVQG